MAFVSQMQSNPQGPLEGSPCCLVCWPVAGSPVPKAPQTPHLWDSLAFHRAIEDPRGTSLGTELGHGLSGHPKQAEARRAVAPSWRQAGRSPCPRPGSSVALTQPHPRAGSCYHHTSKALPPRPRSCLTVLPSNPQPNASPCPAVLSRLQSPARQELGLFCSLQGLRSLDGRPALSTVNSRGRVRESCPSWTNPRVFPSRNTNRAHLSMSSCFQ